MNEKKELVDVCVEKFKKANEVFDFYIKPLQGIVRINKECRDFYLSYLTKTIKHLQDTIDSLRLFKKEIKQIDSNENKNNNELVSIK